MTSDMDVLHCCPNAQYMIKERGFPGFRCIPVRLRRTHAHRDVKKEIRLLNKICFIIFLNLDFYHPARRLNPILLLRLALAQPIDARGSVLITCSQLHPVA